jgi:hypothetical protein
VSGPAGPDRPGEPDGPTDAEAEAVWNDLVASFHASQAPEGEAPWPESENVTPPPPPAGTLEPGARVVRPAARPAPPRSVDSQLTWTSGAIGPRDVPAPEPTPETFEPPEPEPLPSLDWPARAAWLGALGGPGYLMAATILNWQTPTWIAVGCAFGGLCGFGYLVSRLKPHRDDDDDDNFGAVI